MHIGLALVVFFLLPHILFFDDLASNVAGARAAGLQAVQVSGPRDVREGLRALDLL